MRAPFLLASDRYTRSEESDNRTVINDGDSLKTRRYAILKDDVYPNC